MHTLFCLDSLRKFWSLEIIYFDDLKFTLFCVPFEGLHSFDISCLLNASILESLEPYRGGGVPVFCPHLIQSNSHIVSLLSQCCSIQSFNNAIMELPPSLTSSHLTLGS